MNSLNLDFILPFACRDYISIGQGLYVYCDFNAYTINLANTSGKIKSVLIASVAYPQFLSANADNTIIAVTCPDLNAVYYYDRELNNISPVKTVAPFNKSGPILPYTMGNFLINGNYGYIVGNDVSPKTGFYLYTFAFPGAYGGTLVSKQFIHPTLNLEQIFIWNGMLICSSSLSQAYYIFSLGQPNYPLFKGYFYAKYDGYGNVGYLTLNTNKGLILGTSNNYDHLVSYYNLSLNGFPLIGKTPMGNYLNGQISVGNYAISINSNYRVGGIYNCELPPAITNLNLQDLTSYAGIAICKATGPKSFSSFQKDVKNIYNYTFIENGSITPVSGDANKSSIPPHYLVNMHRPVSLLGNFKS